MYIILHIAYLNNQLFILIADNDVITNLKFHLLKPLSLKDNNRFVEIKVRVTPEKRAIIKEHAKKMEESATSFIKRAIDESMKRYQESNSET